jgi:prepilin-type N-terminal cleavage/methylation domain-containing protein
MARPAARGFTLVEIAITLVIMGIVLAFAVPALQGLSTSHQLKGTAAAISGQLRLAREKAIATGTTQTIRFMAGFQSSDYHIWNGTVADPKWSLPNRISYATGTQSQFRMAPNGRCLDSGLIILQDARGVRDTVSVESSGLVTSN